MVVRFLMPIPANYAVFSETKKLSEKYKGYLDSYVSTNMHGLILLTLQARTNAPEGTGTAFMRELCELADKHAVLIQLTPGDMEKYGYKRTTSVKRLERFYKRFGFVNKMNRQDARPELTYAMYRKPQNTT